MTAANTLAALTGATIAELMAHLGHSTPAAAMRYAMEDRLIRETGANDPAIGYNIWPRWSSDSRT